MIILESLTRRYFIWLCNKLNSSRPNNKRKWTYLLEQMFDTDFYWVVPNDDNRSFDGKVLRDQYAYENGLSNYPKLIRDECSFLEMLVALADRCDTDIMAVEQPTEYQSGHWFWLFLENCGLAEYDDEHYDPDMIDVILNQIMSRNYMSNGFGGLFPLKNPSQDQREVELWYQMNEWLEENYPIDDEF